MPYHRNSVHSNGYSPDGQQGRDESPTYVMEHLATFTVSKETGIVYPADGMRRLLQLEKTNGIWSQKMQLRLDKNLVLIIDNETGDIMEKFPAALIQEPTAFSSTDPMEIYDNILVFIVGDDRPNSHSEMHIFQCQKTSAQEIVEDLKQLRLGKPLNHRGHIPPPPPSPPPEPPLNGVNVREQVSVFNAVSQSERRGGSDAGVGNHDDESSSTSSEKYGRDVTTLNHCFDDIEKFIARLQHSAAASRELERRKKNRKSKKKDMGDGLLTMRAKPPPELEFVDIFQKFKLSFILLAKLKHHIHDPNAPELVHFLFTPLALIVDASHDTKYAQNLPAKVIAPLLTQEAINLLMNCVTSKETELWHSLGDAWLIPKEQWKGKSLRIDLYSWMVGPLIMPLLMK
uniref:Epidermal growth factor receptor kinase substrate 8 n=1 Tax=Lygus hesperus TaxID=30085 RepID=A0A0A9Y009_LYGHE